MVDIAEMVASGMTLQEIADELGDTTPNAVRSRLHRLGTRALSRFEQSVQHRVNCMRPTEAVDYLLGVLSCVAGAMVCGEAHEVDDLGVHLAPAERRVLIVLWDANGATVSKEALWHAATALSDDPAPPKIVDSYIHRLRKKLPRSACTLRTIWGYGAALEREKKT